MLKARMGILLVENSILMQLILQTLCQQIKVIELLFQQNVCVIFLQIISMEQDKFPGNGIF